MTLADDHRRPLDLERTRLANERTLLAYIRTALALAAAGASVAFLFDTPPPAARVVGWALLSAGVLTQTIGAWRFIRVARRLRG